MSDFLEAAAAIVGTLFLVCLALLVALGPMAILVFGVLKAVEMLK